MERGRLTGVNGPGGAGSGYAVGGRLVLTSAHVAGAAGGRVTVFHPGADGTAPGTVVWCGTPGGRDDAALVRVDDGPLPPARPVRWGRLVTSRPGAGCETWGVPDVAQRPRAAVEAEQLEGRVNPGSGFVGNQYVMDLLQHPPQWSPPATSPWGGLSGAAVFCDRLLTGVVASDRAHSGHARLNVVPAYVLHHSPAFRAALAEHGAGAAAELEAVEFQHLTERTPPAVGASPPAPAALLEARHQTVPFHGRTDLLRELRAWCGRNGFGAWLLHGPGGQGKTRLAHHLAHRLAADRWTVLWPDTEATAGRLAQVGHAVTPLLVVLDYAENRTDQLRALVRAAADHPGSTPLKLLLLARTGGDWWREAVTATPLAADHLATAPTRLLTDLEDDPARRADAYGEAARALAAALPRVGALAGHDWTAVAARLTPPRLDQPAYGNALTLHMTALADLLDTTVPGPRREGAAGVEDRLLDHERRHWRQSAATLGLTPGLSHATLETALAAAHLTPVTDRERVDLLWRRLPALADQPRDRRDRVTAWLATLYPATETSAPWGALHPDRLAERHIGHVLEAAPSLADHLLDGADGEDGRDDGDGTARRERLLAVCCRAASHPVFDGSLDAWLTQWCLRRYRELLPQIIATATRTDHPGSLIDALGTLVDDPATPLDDLRALSDGFPLSSRRLADVAVRMAETLVARHRVLAEAEPDAHRSGLALSLNNLSNRLGEVGRLEEGLSAIEEAAGIRRALAAAAPDVYLPNLAVALNNLSSRLGQMGRPAESLTAAEEAVGHYRALAGADPGAYRSGLAGSLHNLSVALGETGRGEEGLAAVEEAVSLQRALAEADMEAHLPGLARSLNTLFNRLGQLGRWERSLAVMEEAVGHYRGLAEANPDAHLPDLAMALTNLAIVLGETGRRERGLAVIEEALGIRRALDEAHPEVFGEALRRTERAASWLRSRTP